MRSAAVRSLVRLGLWTAGLVGVARALLAMRSPSLVVPLGSYQAFSDWLAGASPPDMAIGLLRLAALAAVFYLLAVTVLGVVARVARVRGLALAVDRISPAVVRRVITGGSGIGLVLGGLIGSLPSPTIGSPSNAAAVAAAPAVAHPDTVASPTATMVRLPTATATMTRITEAPHVAGPNAQTAHHVTPAAGVPDRAPDRASTSMRRDDQPGVPSATMTRLDPQSGSAGGPVVTVATPAGDEHPPAPLAADERWTVAPGESLWTIAEAVMAGPDGSPADERAVGRYWQHLIDANRADLVDPGNPDLLLPGQELTLPPSL